MLESSSGSLSSIILLSIERGRALFEVQAFITTALFVRINISSNFRYVMINIRHLYTLLPILYTVSYSTTIGVKVGLLIPKNNSYSNAIRTLTSYAAQKTSYTLVTTEYENKKLLKTIDACCELINSGVSAVITIGDSSDAAIKSDIFTPLKIPLIAVSATDPYLWNNNREYLIRLSASDFYQNEAIYDLIKHYKWPEVTILGTADAYGMNGMIKLENLLVADSSITIKDVLYFPTDNCDISDQLMTIQHSLVKVIVLNVSVKFGKCVLEKAHEMGLMGSDYVWIVTDAIAAQPEYLAEHDGNFLSFYEGLIGIRPAQIKGAEYSKLKDSYILDGGEVDDLTSYTVLSYDAVGLIEAALEKTSEDLTQNSVKCSSKSEGWDKGKTVLDSILKSNYTGISGEISFTHLGEKSNVAYDILNFVDDKFTTVGIWTNTSGLKMSKSKTVQFFEETNVVPTGIAMNLVGRHLRLGTTEEEPFMFYSTEGCEANECWTGMVNDMVVQLANELGFTYEYIPPADLKFGALNETTKEWNGMIADLLADRIDMIAIDLSTNTERKTAIDFSLPFMDAGIKVVVMGESGTSNKFFFLFPFNGNVWGMVFVMNFILVGLICFLGKFSPFGKYAAKLHAVRTCSCYECTEKSEEMKTKDWSLQSNKKYKCLVRKVEEKDTSSEASLYNSLWLMSTGLVGQTSETLPYCLSGRFLMIIWWAFTLILISMYTANLTAFLTLSNIGIPLKTVLDLLDQDTYKWGLIGSRHPETLLKNHLDSRYSRLVDDGIPIKNLEEAFEKVRKGQFVFIDESPIMAHNLRGDCEIMSLGEDFNSFEYAFGLPKNSPYKALIDAYLLKFRENGFIDMLWHKWSAGTSVCSRSEMGKKTTLDLSTLAGIFILLCIGTAISFVLFLLELIYVSLRDIKQNDGLSFMKAFKDRIKCIRNVMFLKGNRLKKNEV